MPCDAAAAFCCSLWDLYFNCTAYRKDHHTHRNHISLRCISVSRMHNMCRFHRRRAVEWEWQAEYMQRHFQRVVSLIVIMMTRLKIREREREREREPIKLSRNKSRGPSRMFSGRRALRSDNMIVTMVVPSTAKSTRIEQRETV